MTSEGQPDHQPTSAHHDEGSMYGYEPPPPTAPPAPYGYPPAADPHSSTHGDPVPPAPDRVRGSAAVPADLDALQPPASQPRWPEQVSPSPPQPAAPPHPAPPPPPPPPSPPPAPPPAAVPRPAAYPVPPQSPPEPPGPPPRVPIEEPPTAFTPGGSGPTRAAASVPTANRATPQAGETPSFTPQPRVYQTVAGPPQPVSPPQPAGSAHQAGPPQPMTPPPMSPPQPVSPPQQAAPVQPVSPLPTRTPGETPLPTRTPGETPLPTRASLGPPLPTRPPRPRQAAGLPVYSDLLAPETAPPLPAAPAPPPPMSAPPPAQPESAQPMWQAPPEPPAAPATAPGEPYIPQQRMGVEPAEHQPAGQEVGGGPGKSGPSTGIIVGAVLVGATLLVLGALSVPFLLQQLRGPSESGSYTVGDCVVQAGADAEPADCSEPNAYEIVSQVDRQEDCDPTQPAIRVDGPPAQVYCLTPAATEPEPTDE
jgi:hypothetical protein